MRIGRFVEEQHQQLAAEGTNICGVLVMARPEHVPAVEKALAATAGIEIHHIGADGRMVVTVEDTADQWAGQILTKIPTIEGVLSTSLVYHHCETGDLDKELNDDSYQA